MNIITVNPVESSEWQQLCEDYRTDIFHSPGWLNVLASTYDDMEVLAHILVDDDGKPLAGLPFCRVKDMMGKRIASLSFSDYCDPLVANRDQWEALFGMLLAEDCPLATRVLHNDIPLEDERLTMTYQAKWHGIDLDRELDDIWMGLAGSARRAVRKAEKEGVTVRDAVDESDVRAFFDMHLGIRKYKYHLVAQPYEFFRNIWQHCVQEQGGALKLACYEDEVIGGVMFLEWSDTLYYKFNASSIKALEVRPNDLVVWEGIQHAKHRGLKRFDFGLSDSDQEGLLRYKRKYATEEKEISFLKYRPQPEVSAGAQQMRGLLNQLTDLFTDESVPDEITEKAGAVLYQYFT
jgi:CelD/BcsL family acetyltransferase involved in cellulose biosynthesis